MDFERRKSSTCLPSSWSAPNIAPKSRMPCCHKIVTAPFPQEVKAPVQYGKNFRSLLAYFYDAQLGASLRIRQMCEEMFGYAVSEGTVQAPARSNTRPWSPLKSA